MKFLFLLIIVVLAFFPFPNGANPELWRRIFDLMHIPAFAVIYWFLYQAIAGGCITPGATRTSYSILATLFLAATVEIIQPLFGRSGNLGDVGIGAAGIIIAAAGLPLWQTRRFSWKKIWHTAAACLVLGFFALPVLDELLAMRWRKLNFPLLASFEDAAEQRLWLSLYGAEISQAVQPPNGRSLSIITQPGNYSGVEYLAGDMDWSSYRTFSFDIHNPGEPFTLLIRIDDNADCREYDNRFNTKVEVSRGNSTLSLSTAQISARVSSRQFKLANIRRVLFFVEPQDSARSFHLDNVRLGR